MKINTYLSKFINTLRNNKEKNKLEHNSITLNEHIKRFTYIACAISKDDIDIIASKDTIGGYYEKKLILPSKINISTKKSTNLLCYLYKIIFSLTSKQKKFYLPENNSSLDYILLASMLTVKTVNRIMHKDFPNIKHIKKVLYPKINTSRPNIKLLNGRQLLLEIGVKKFLYQQIKHENKLEKDDAYWLYKLENIKNITAKNIKSNLITLYNDLCKIHKNSNNIELNQLWGYLYYEEKTKLNTSFKKITTNIQQITNKNNIDLNIKIKKHKLDSNKEKKTTLNSLFDYKKTTDKYQSGNKNSDDSSNNLEILKDLNINNVTRNSTKIESIFSINTLNSIRINKLENNFIYTKKLTYKEWDFEIKKYKQNWCHLFLKKDNIKFINTSDKKLIEELLEKNNKQIKLFKEKFNLLMNKKSWIKRQEHGEDIDFDSIIDNYKYVKHHNFKKIYKYKKNTNKNLAVSILFDSSLSTDSYSNNEKIITTLKKLTLILSSGINNLVENFSISTFHSNTRHDCKYIIIKDFENDWTKVKYNIANISPNGYTRIGPAIRHATQELKNIKAKQKLILLLSDGKPTDYDEYEGSYGINDIKHAIHEANIEKIHIKSIITDDIPRSYFPRMFGFKNYILITNKKPLHHQLLKSFLDTIKH